MSYFPAGTLEDKIFGETQYVQRIEGVSNTEISRALVKVLEYYIESIEESEK